MDGLTAARPACDQWCMDAAAILVAPLVVALELNGLSDFLGGRHPRVVQVHAGPRPFGLLLKALLHGRLGTSLRCGRIAVAAFDSAGPSTRPCVEAMVALAGVAGSVAPPAGFYLFRGSSLVGYHPELPATGSELADLAWFSARSAFRRARRGGAEAQRALFDDRPELGVVEFFEEAVLGWTPRRAPAAEDRRARRDRRGGHRGAAPRRADEREQAQLEAAFAFFGLPTTAGLQAVKQARNRLMRATHPDRLTHDPARQTEATRLAVQVNEAFAHIRRASESHEG